MTIRNKIALTFSLMTGTLILVLSVFLYLFVARFGQQAFMSRVRERAYIAARTQLEDDERNVAIYKDVRQNQLQTLPDEEDYILSANPSERHRQENEELHALPTWFYEEALSEGDAEFHQKNNFYVGIHYPTHQGDHLVLVRARDTYGAQSLATLRHILFTGFALSLILTFVLGRVFSHQIIQPIARIITNVNRIGASNLHLRLDTGNGKDELAELSQTFNRMLDRLETAFELQSNFVSNASHELRTPLTTVMGEAEFALKKPREAEVYVTSLENIYRESCRLNQLTSMLLRLSQIGYDGQKQQMAPVRLDELLLEFKRNLDERLPDNQVRLRFEDLPAEEEALQLICNQEWMELALHNVVHNGIKYSDNQPVQLALSADVHQQIITVQDRGIGVAPEDQDHLFEPFFRGQNVTTYQGNGIGLSLAGKIIRSFGGQITVDSTLGQGTTVTIAFRRVS
ncbi:Signal transduction histidine kinase [Catalinimonas alkaloidigena]|uniref:histidine kinase n=1 Tax=Catalinimonas alkaloidigena TaxID=1075417 RepID=A0A1G9AIC7_9BACT|nr:HAMP domain-containing sensor histidine kinase [Catalinimonas alkaloidigena]SDK27126.1 Signal transduction histidine kinase [Catalinimonas alkaloidigena]